MRQFLQWLRRQDEEQVLSRALIGGFFMYPPPAFSLETYMKDRRGQSSTRGQIPDLYRQRWGRTSASFLSVCR